MTSGTFPKAEGRKLISRMIAKLGSDSLLTNFR